MRRGPNEKARGSGGDARGDGIFGSWAGTTCNDHKEMEVIGFDAVYHHVPRAS